MKHINLLILLDFFVTHQILVVMENQHVAELWVIGWVEGVFMQRAADVLAATFKGVVEGVRQRRVEVVRNLEFAI